MRLPVAADVDFVTRCCCGEFAVESGYAAALSNVTRILTAIELENPQALAKLLPLVHDELRRHFTMKLVMGRRPRSCWPME